MAQQRALVTGASSGIGLELARLCAKQKMDLLICADEELGPAKAELEPHGVSVETFRADLSTLDGVDGLIAANGGRPVDFLLANAGHGLGHAFLDQSWDDIRHVIDTNVTGTVYLAHRIVREMASRGTGRVLFTGSIAGFMPGTYQAVYNATKAFVDSFAIALRHELQDSGVSITVLMPGPTDTAFFERAGMLDTPVGRQKKDDPADVAEAGFRTMMDGDEQVVSGFKNKLQAAAAHVMPAGRLAEQHRKLAEPGRES